MKILWTGFTSNQTNMMKNEPPVKIVNFPKTIIDTAHKLGHKVDWKCVPFAEKPDRYDAIVINAAPCNSFMGRYGALQTFRLAADAYDARIPVIIYFDDWQVNNFFSNAKVLLKNPQKIYRSEPISAGSERYGLKGGDSRPFFFTCKKEEIKANEEKILRGIKLLIQGKYDRFATMLSKHKWGNVTKAIARIPTATEVRTCFLDPTPVIPEWSHRPKVNFATKKKAWILPALIPHDKWIKKQHLRWPVDLFGCKKLKAPRLATEPEIMDEVAQRWGSLAPEYPHAGSGWFRSRYLYAAWGRTIMYCSGYDACALGEPFTLVRNSLYGVEQVWDDKKLQEIAEAQAKVIESFIPTYDEYVAMFEGALKLAVRSAA